jgi:hypothetical protein
VYAHNVSALERLSTNINVVLLVSPNTDIQASENEFIFKYQYVFLYSFHGVTCLYQRTLQRAAMLFELCDGITNSTNYCDDAGQRCTVPEQTGPKETFIEQTDQYQYHGTTVYFDLD